MSYTGRLDIINDLTRARSRIEATQKAWEDKVNQIKAQHTYHPAEPQIQPSTAIADAIITLARILAHYNHRLQLHGRPSHSLTDVLLSHVKPLQSTETNIWYVQRSLAYVEQRLLSCFRILEEAEQLRSRKFSQMLQLQAHLLEFEQSEKMAILVEGVALADHALELTDDMRSLNNVEIEQARRQLDTATGFTDEFRRALGAHDRSVNGLLWMVSLMSGKVARQMMITEFFKPVR